jgi:autoinducer 2-degrading protein
MHIIQIHVSVKENLIQNFIDATIENAKSSILEPGILRFDIIQQIDEPANFVLYEIYRTEQDTAKHKNMEHYRVWRDKVQSMMSEPRRSVKYQNIFPD